MKMDEQNVRKWVIRAWGNAYIGFENNVTTMGQMKDMDNVARAVGLTIEDKIYAIKLMGGDQYGYAEAEYALMKFVETGIDS